MTIKWDDSLELGIESIDRQHQEIFRQTNKFLKAYKEKDYKKSKEELKDLFYFLTDYVVTHFNDEEQIQKKYNYPEYENHNKRHKKFIERLNSFKYDFFQNNEIDDRILTKVNDEILEWLVIHIGNEDKEVAEYIKSQ